MWVIAIPVLHSSGGWIIAAGGSYIAGTFAWSWIGAFILGNAGWLSGLGLVSVAGLIGASGGLSVLASGAALSLGAGLTSLGLGGVATYLGIAPTATFLGLTPAGWLAAGISAVVAVVGGWFLVDSVMTDINAERVKGGLSPITVKEIVLQVREVEEESLQEIVQAIMERDESVLATETGVIIHGVEHPMDSLRYVINSDGSEGLVSVSYMVLRKSVYETVPAVDLNDEESAGWFKTVLSQSQEVTRKWFASDDEEFEEILKAEPSPSFWDRSKAAVVDLWPWSPVAQ